MGAAGVARNGNKYLGPRADSCLPNLPLRDSTQNLALATGATTHAYFLTLDPIIVNIPFTKQFSTYFLLSAFLHRSENCNPTLRFQVRRNSFWVWRGACQNSNFSLSQNGSFVNSSLNEFGYNVGAGVAQSAALKSTARPALCTDRTTASRPTIARSPLGFAGRVGSSW